MNGKNTLNEQNLEQVAGGGAEPAMAVTFTCRKCGRQKKVTYSEAPENPTCCGQKMTMVGGITNNGEGQHGLVNNVPME